MTLGTVASTSSLFDIASAYVAVNTGALYDNHNEQVMGTTNVEKNRE
jgi:hypothetical protein